MVDCGFSLEDDEELWFDTTAPRRNGATLAVLEAADTVLCVGGADPVALQRRVRALAELRDAGTSNPSGRTQQGAAFRRPATRDGARAALTRFAGARQPRSCPPTGGARCRTRRRTDPRRGAAGQPAAAGPRAGRSLAWISPPSRRRRTSTGSAGGAAAAPEPCGRHKPVRMTRRVASFSWPDVRRTVASEIT